LSLLQQDSNFPARRDLLFVFHSQKSEDIVSECDFFDVYEVNDSINAMEEKLFSSFLPQTEEEVDIYSAWIEKEAIMHYDAWLKSRYRVVPARDLVLYLFVVISDLDGDIKLSCHCAIENHKFVLQIDLVDCSVFCGLFGLLKELDELLPVGNDALKQ
jgi:hypothetical protein